jgi:hypothetical protein
VLLPAERLARTVCCAVATLLIGVTWSGCKKTQERQSDTSGTLVIQMRGQVSHSDSSATDKPCQENTGANDHPPSINQPTQNGSFSAYQMGVCFAYSDSSGDTREWSEIKNRLPGNVPMWIMPEARMRHTDPTADADSGQGMVVALVRNNDQRNVYADDAWNGQKLVPHQDALIWLSKDQHHAVIFTYGNQNHIVILASGTWTKMDVNPSHQNPQHAEALWDHPPALDREDNSVAVAERPPYSGSGWVTCLIGCCTPDGLFSVQ